MILSVVLSVVGDMSPEDEPLSPLRGVSCTGEDATLSRGDLASSHPLERRSRAPSSLHTKTQEADVIWYCLILPLDTL